MLFAITLCFTSVTASKCYLKECDETTNVCTFTEIPCETTSNTGSLRGRGSGSGSGNKKSAAQIIVDGKKPYYFVVLIIGAICVIVASCVGIFIIITSEHDMQFIYKDLIVILCIVIIAVCCYVIYCL